MGILTPKGGCRVHEQSAHSWSASLRDTQPSAPWLGYIFYRGADWGLQVAERHHHHPPPRPRDSQRISSRSEGGGAIRWCFKKARGAYKQSCLGTAPSSHAAIGPSQLGLAFQIPPWSARPRAANGPASTHPPHTLFLLPSPPRLNWGLPLEFQCCYTPPPVKSGRERL
jgi:hypothetical protein